MKKLLIASAVLAGMGISQAFAAPSDDWSGSITLAMPNQCEISDDVKTSLGAATITGTGPITTPAVFTASQTQAGVDANNNGLMDQNWSLKVLFDQQSFCNYAHNFSVERQYGGFTYAGSSAPNAISDAFLKGIPYALAVDVNTWDPQVTNGIALTQLAHTAVVQYVANQPGAATTTSASVAAGGWLGLDNDTEASVPPFHNDGDVALSNNATTGLALVLTHSAVAGSNAIPYLAGNYSEQLHLRIGGVL